RVMTKSATPSFTRRKFLSSATALAAPCAIASAAPAAQTGLKIFVLWDMEGTSGIFTREQAWYWEAGVREQVALDARGIFTSNVNALSAAALERGATELIVCDTHHGGGNLIREKLSADSRIKYEYRSVGLENGNGRWMPNLDRRGAVRMVAGHHAKALPEGRLRPRANRIGGAD